MWKSNKIKSTLFYNNQIPTEEETSTDCGLKGQSCNLIKDTRRKAKRLYISAVQGLLLAQNTTSYKYVENTQKVNKVHRTTCKNVTVL